MAATDTELKDVSLDDAPKEKTNTEVIDNVTSHDSHDDTATHSDGGRSSLDPAFNEQEKGHTVGHYAQLDQETSKPKLARNPYISILFHNKRFLIIWMSGVLSGMGNYFSEIGKFIKQPRLTLLKVSFLMWNQRQMLDLPQEVFSFPSLLLHALPCLLQVCVLTSLTEEKS